MTAYTAVRPTTDCGTRLGGQKPNIIVLHHTAGVMSIDTLVAMMQPGGRTVSAHAAIKDRDIVSVVPESKRAYALADGAFDSRAFNAECINSTGSPTWQLSDATHESIARWVADVCKRWGIRPHRSGPAKSWTIIGHREVYSIHRVGYATACPGGMKLDWVVTRAQQLMEDADMPTPQEIAKAVWGTPITRAGQKSNALRELADAGESSVSAEAKLDKVLALVGGGPKPAPALTPADHQAIADRVADLLASRLKT